MVSRMQVLRQNATAAGLARCRRLVFVCIGLAVLLSALYIGSALVSTSEFSQPEGIVATQVTTFSQQGTLYYSLKQYPYTVCAYMPMFYTAVAALAKAGIPVLLGGRLVSIFALLGSIWLAWKLILLYTEDRLYAWLGAGLLGITPLMLSWGTTGQVDMLTVSLALAAFYQFSRFHLLAEERLDLAAAFAVAALFTKQTAIAAPATIFVLLLWRHPRRAFRFALLTAGVGGSLVLGLNALLDGRFLDNTVFANMNPFAWYKLGLSLEFVGVVLSPMLLIALIGLKPAHRLPMHAVFVYLGFAQVIYFLTAPKVGADTNYLIESNILLVVCACCGLKALDFFALFSIGSKSWITLLMLPLGLFVVQNLRVSASTFKSRIDRESNFAVQVEGLRPFLGGSGRVLSADSNALQHAGRSFEVEPLIYRLLVEAGRIEAAPVLRDIDSAAFESILLYEDVAKNNDPDPEIPRLTRDQMDAIRRRYQLVRHVPGPYLGGIFVYQPRNWTAHLQKGDAPHGNHP